MDEQRYLVRERNARLSVARRRPPSNYALGPENANAARIISRQFAVLALTASQS